MVSADGAIGASLSCDCYSHWPNLAPGKDADASVERQADDLAGIIRTLGIPPARIVGHSYGGAVAINLTLRHPELVRTLVLAEPAVSGVLASSQTL
jgi:pimeloyl-ACP methyl ester carboxylesterase